MAFFNTWVFLDMNFTNFNTHNDAHDRAFEVLCNQLFERWMRREYKGRLTYFMTVNGAGGDGGVEAYGTLDNSDAVGVQSKWFRTSLTPNQIGQIGRSIDSAKKVRPTLKRYIVCLPRDFQSDKIGKGKKTVEDTEENRLNGLIEEVHTLYPDVVLELWNEYRIREELQIPRNEGIFRFWFEKEELSIDLLRQRFQLARSGWLKERYVPSLHSQGKIEVAANEVLYSNPYRKVEIARLEAVKLEIARTAQYIDEFNKLAGTSNEFESSLYSIKDLIEKSMVQLTETQAAIRNGQDGLIPTSIPELPILSIKDAISSKPLPNTFRNIKLSLRLGLEEADRRLGKEPYAHNRAKKNRPHNLVIFGGPGTGKTHGVANAVEKRLDEGAPAIIVNTSGTPNTNWATILQSVLGGLHNWSDAEILSALESLAARTDAYRAGSTDQSDLINEPTHILICLDGIDEAKNITAWRERIAETRHWINTFPRIRFLITSRSYPYVDENPCKLDLNDINRRFDLPMEGDVPLAELAPHYFREYDVNTVGAPWVVESFENALSLRLFCEEYKGKTIALLPHSVSTGLAQLLNAKIERIETEFYEKNAPVWSKTEQVIRKSLIAISTSLNQASPIEHDRLCQHIVNEVSVVDRSWAGKLVDAYTEHGVLLKGEIINDDGISPAVVTYSISYQSYLDYFFSITAASEVVRTHSKAVPAILRAGRDYNCFRLTATTLLADHQLLIGENGYWTTELDGPTIDALQCDALSNGSDEVIQAFLPILKAKFLHSTRERNVLLFRFVIPNLHRKALNLGINFLHEALWQFPDSFSRDLFWSGPEKFSKDEKMNIGYTLLRFHLQHYHQYNELPLVFGWSLTTTHNGYREHCQSELTKWGFHHPERFIELLDVLFPCNDPQVQEDLATILQGISSLFNDSDPGLVQLAQWVDENIFSPSKITGMFNSVVRHSSRVLVERAFSFGDCGLEAVKRARPPYLANDLLLPLDAAAAGSRQQEIYPIVHDLAWYVIEYSYRGFLEFEDGRTTSPEGETLLQRYRDRDHVDVGPNDFALGAAIAYIKGLGWNRGEGHGMTEESHGAISKQATFEEKYTWLAVRYIQGYLADRLPFKQNDTYIGLITDYNWILYKPNPVNEDLEDPKGPLRPLMDAWYIPAEISPAMIYQDSTLKSDIKAWVNRADLPAFDRWINVDGLRFTKNRGDGITWQSLYMDIKLPEVNNIGVTHLTLICCLIEKNKFDHFVNLMKDTKKKIYRFTFDDISRLWASPMATTYASVKDVVSIDWMGEEESSLELGDGDDTYYIQKTVTSVVQNTINDGEDRYKIPAKQLRTGVSITDTDKVHLFDKNKELTAFFYKHGVEGYDFQEFLIIDEEKFRHFLEREGFTPFWIAHQFARTTSELLEKHRDYHAQNSKQWIVWEDADKINAHLFHDGHFSS